MEEEKLLHVTNLTCRICLKYE